MRHPWKIRYVWQAHPFVRQFRWISKLDFEASLLVCVVLLCVISPIKYPTAMNYEYLELSEIKNDLQLCGVSRSDMIRVEHCPIFPLNLAHFKHAYRTVNLTALSLLANITKIQPGGLWSPPNCLPWQKVAIIVPYRDRKVQLHHFLQHMHPYLQAQLLDYGVFVVEQSEKHDFNRGKLFNIGFKEASKNPDFCCFVFHDVDLLPESPEHIYGCSSKPRHMCSAVNTFRYVLPYPELFGGVVAFTKKQYERVNGYSNMYFGWGGEDDDLYKRVSINKWKVQRWDPHISRFTMLRHTKAIPNPERFKLLMYTQHQMHKDGLSTLNYKILARRLEPLYTWILVDVEPYTLVVNSMEA